MRASIISALSSRTIVSALVAVILLEWFFYPILEHAGLIEGAGRTADQLILTRSQAAMNLATPQSPICSTLGVPVSIVRKKTKRILVMGDSYVWGGYSANYNQIWWRQLADVLRCRGYQNVEIIAAGQARAATLDEVDWAGRILPIYKPDLIIVGFVEDDLTPEIQVPVPTKDEDAAQTLIELLQPLLPNITARLTRANQAFRAKSFDATANGARVDQLYEPDNMANYRSTLASLAQLATNYKIPMVAITQPIVSDPGMHLRHFALADQLFMYAGIPFYDLMPDFAAIFPPPTDWWEIAKRFWSNPYNEHHNEHPDTAINHFYAVEVADLLERNLPQCLGPRSQPVTMISDRPKFTDWCPASIGLINEFGGSVSFEYPDSDKKMLTMPIEHPYVQLNLERPVSARSIQLSGPNLSRATVYLTPFNKALEYEDDSFCALDTKEGSKLKWSVDGVPSASRLSSVRVNASFNGPNRKLFLNVTRD